ncbi:MAG: hypothetical protein A2W99_11420 [Bacteroidetes bacterium GWF2_33_16]|nr:MAG: hypothetical protein A2X00_04320 [Bacteroidetes bacterium GWE2_32_14]OFY04140.1 MAG: hypothetical protein A2W99_11420 [Bacteroidetes bacterium GWF2_33_16]
MRKLSKNIRKFNFFEIFLITIFWIILFSSPLLFGQFENGINWNHVFIVWRNHLILFVLFLINRFILLPKLFFTNKHILYIVCAGLLISIAVSVSYVYYTNFGPNSKKQLQRELLVRRSETNRRPMNRISGRTENLPPPLREHPRQIPPYVNILISSFLIFGFDIGLKSSVKWIQSEQKRIKLEKENVENQLAFLRNQVSPHFFMNTLNNIHSLVDINTDEAKEAIIKLSKMMRYLLYETETEKTTLKREIEFLQSYIDLMKLRFNERVVVNLSTPTVIPDKSLPPFLFTSIIENAFKHGVSYKSESFINIEILTGNNRLLLIVKNSKIEKNQNKDFSGIGIENTRKRLALIYGADYHLDIIDNEDTFTINLSIPI